MLYCPMLFLSLLSWKGLYSYVAHLSAEPCNSVLCELMWPGVDTRGSKSQPSCRLSGLISHWHTPGLWCVPAWTLRLSVNQFRGSQTEVWLKCRTCFRGVVAKGVAVTFSSSLYFCMRMLHRFNDKREKAIYQTLRLSWTISCYTK